MRTESHGTRRAWVMGTLNAGGTPAHIMALSAAEPNVHAFTRSFGRHDADRAGCTHEFVLIGQAKVGAGAARFTASCDAQAGGWALSSRELPQPIDLTGLKAIRAWVNGDAKGEDLKIQLYDGVGGYRDTYIPINLEGWQQVTVAESFVNALRWMSWIILTHSYGGWKAQCVRYRKRKPR